MRCPYCNHTSSEVVETRIGEEGSNIRRRRLCSDCNKRFTTYERIEAVTLIVRKRDGKREQFSREKLKIGLLKSCEKTTVSLQEIENIVAGIERELRCGDSLEIESEQVGKMVADQLKKKDKLAYIRFASVFKHFVDLDDFAQELKILNKTN
ncbi:MAG TPA: transcriptional regulator NrdR, partial [Candidatus Levybacteria bacterium]|nr:transcriptional regulator NrdR [Candidatus Levybacteria bacterium]